MTTYRRLARIIAATSGSWLTTDSSAVTVPNDPIFAPGTDDFTIEWFGYYTSAPNFSTPFAIGSYSTQNYQIRVSFEGSSVYAWYSENVGTGRKYVRMTGPSFTLPLNTWSHFALVRTSATNLKFYINGVLTYTGTWGGDGFIHYQPDAKFGIGTELRNDGTLFTGTVLPGSTSNFRWSNIARYSGSTLTVPTTHLLNDSNTVLLLRAETAATMFKDSSDNGFDASAVGTVTYQVDSPFA